ncbi:MAG: DNA polymerase I [Coriobacteriales bacterium]|jgi:DNA polymerase-1|nr:DNA polymerase I [Coriobacteriales bacterium]
MALDDTALDATQDDATQDDATPDSVALDSAAQNSADQNNAVPDLAPTPPTPPTSPAPQPQRTIAVIDGNSLMHRAFHAVPTYMTAPDGRPTNACFGFLSMLLKLVDNFAPHGIVCAFDHGIPAFRFAAVEKYKAQRPPTDPDLKAQFPIIKQVLAALNIPVVELDGWEGDDILGTLAAQGEQQGMRTLLVTGDKDALQLASENTCIVNTKSGMTDVIVYDPAAVVEKWGIPPERVPDFLGLMGDTSDNIPGIPGVGPKTATKLLQEYGSLEAVLAHGDDIKGKLGENVRGNKEQALASREVATIIRDVPVECDLGAVDFPSYDAQAVSETFREFALTVHLKKALGLIGQKPGAVNANGAGANGAGANGVGADAAGANVPESLRAVLASPPLTAAAALEALDAALKAGATEGQHQPLAALIEATSGDSLFENTTVRLLYIASHNSIMCFEESQIPAVCTRIIQEGILVAHDSKQLLQKLVGRNSAERAALDPRLLDPARIFDLGLAAYLLDSSKDYSNPEVLLEQFLPGELPAPTEAVGPGALRAAAFLKLYEILKAQLTSDESLSCFSTIEMPLVPVLVRMERWGVNVDPAILAHLGTGMEATIAGLKTQAVAEAGEDFNLDSPKQLGAILFDKLKLPVIKKTRTGYSTDASVLQELKGLHPLASIMLEYRELAKLKSTYLDALPQLIASDRHIHTSYNQAVAATGRLSSSDPNLQNIPVRTELGRRIRTAFIPDPSVFDEGAAIFLSADYSQIELRLLAHLSGDEGLIEAFVGGADFHASTASRVFDIPVAQVTPQLRSRAKAVNFGIVYGQQAYGLSQSLGIPFTEAQEMITRYFQAYPQVRRYLDETVQQAREQGFVRTLYGRKRHIRELRSGNANQRGFGERTAMNHPMQGSAADIIKLAMIEVQRRLDAEGFVSQMVLQVHDELDFNCATSEQDRLSAMVKEAMEGIAQLKVPLVVDVTTGPNWALAH